jgi:hypothetical protein
MLVPGSRSQVVRVLLLMLLLVTAIPSFGSRRIKSKADAQGANLPAFSLPQTAHARYGVGPRTGWILNLPLGGPSQYARLLVSRAPGRPTSLPPFSSQGTASRSNRNAPPPATADTFTNGAGSGLWSNASNWSLGAVPNSSDDADITGTGTAASVTEDVSATINNLNLGGTGNSWNLNNNEALTIDGTTISNPGKMTMNSTGNLTELIINSGNVTLSGGGTLTMSNSADNLIFADSATDTLTNQETIQGSGNIGDGQMTLVNSGTINANQPTPLIVSASRGVTNTGTMEATNGILDLLNTGTVTNTSGTISANNSTIQVVNSTVTGGTVTLTGASVLQLSNGIVESGTLTNSSTGVIESLSNTNNTIGGTITNPAGGLIQIDNNSTLNLAGGTYTGLGAVAMNSTGNNVILQIDANATLSGGSIAMTNYRSNLIYGSTGGTILTNQETISGSGNIGDGQMTLVNSGTINANNSAGLVIQASGGTTNTGTIEATNGTLLTLNGSTTTNTGGTISASGGGNLLVENATVTGGTVTLSGTGNLYLDNGTVESGTITNTGTGIIESESNTNNTLGGTVTNPSTGVVQIDNNSTLNLQSGTYSTLGTVKLNSTGNNVVLEANGANITLSGGSVAMTNYPTNFIFGAATGDVLTNQETISGSGNIGDGQMTLVNSGTINGNGSAGLVIEASGGTTNTGTIEATNGALLTFNGSTVTNTGGTISASGGGNLFVENATVTGGTVTLSGTGNLYLSNGTVESGTITNTGTGIIESESNTNNTLGGTITNPSNGVVMIDNNSTLNLQSGTYSTLGTVKLNSGGNDVILEANGANVTLTGGSVVMTNYKSNLIFGGATGDVLTNQETISGSGNIGDNQMTLVNSGTINANGSAGLVIEANGGTTNTGMIEATSGALLTFNGSTVTNTGGTISASGGGNLFVQNATVTGGTVTLSGTGNLYLSNGTVESGTITNTGTGFIESESNTNNTLGGTITNPSNGVVMIDNNSTLNLQNGTYSTLGTVKLNSTGNNVVLEANGANITLSGGGVVMTNFASNFIVGAASTDTLTNQETISGSGNIGDGQMTLVNSGTINANGSAGLVIQASGGTTNTGTIEATNGSLLTFSGSTITNTSGTISANNSNIFVSGATINGGNVTLTGTSALYLSNGTVQSGTLTNSATGLIESQSNTNNTLGGTITNPAGGVIQVDNNSTLNLQAGTYTNSGNLAVNSTGNNTVLEINGASVTLTGGGSVTMSDSANNFVQAPSSADILTNQETIQGSGNLGNGTMGLVNSGTIIADHNIPLIINTSSSGFNNTGTLTINTADVLEITSNTPFQNFSGTTLTGGTYNVSGTFEFGGSGTSLVTNAANITLTGPNAQIIDSANQNVLANFATNATGASFTLAGGANFTTAGNFTNNGTLTVGGGSKFDVNGNLTNQTGTTLTGGVYNITGTLQYNGADIVTNSANITLTGSGSIISQTAANALTGFNTNATGASFALAGGANFTTAANFTNNGTLTVGSGSTFDVNGTLTNISGTTITAGTYNVTGLLKANNASGITTNAANITLTGTGAIQNQSGTNALTGLATNSTGSSFTINGGANFTTAAAFTNSGTLTVGSGSTFTSTGN